MTVERFLHDHYDKFKDSPPSPAFLTTLRTADFSVPNAGTFDTLDLRLHARGLRQYIDLEYDPDAARSLKWWRSARLFNARFAFWHFQYDNQPGIAAVCDLFDAARTPFYHPEYPVPNLPDPPLVIWTVGRILHDMRCHIVRRGDSYILLDYLSHKYGELPSTANWSALHSFGTLDIPTLAKRDKIDLSVTCDDLIRYRLKHAWLLNLMRTYKGTVPRLERDTAASCVFPESEIADAIRNQNTFTCPEGLDGQLDRFTDPSIAPPQGDTGPKFLRTGQIGRDHFWLWSLRDKLGNDVYLIAQRSPASSPKLNEVICIKGFAPLTPDQAIAFHFFESRRQSGLIVRKHGTDFKEVPIPE